MTTGVLCILDLLHYLHVVLVLAVDQSLRLPVLDHHAGGVSAHPHAFDGDTLLHGLVEGELRGQPFVDGVVLARSTGHDGVCLIC